MATTPCKNVSFEALPYKPNPKNQSVTLKSTPKDLELTQDMVLVTESVKSDSLVSNDPVDPKIEELDDSSTKNNKQVEVVRGEASLLDSADEDSGIESSTNATLERQISN